MITSTTSTATPPPTTTYGSLAARRCPGSLGPRPAPVTGTPPTGPQRLDQLHPGQRRAQAEVHARAERQVRVRSRSRPSRRRARRPRGRGWRRPAAPRSSGRARPTTPATVDVLGRGPLEQLQRGVEPEHLLHAWRRRRLRAAAPAQHGDQPVAEHVDRRLVAGVEQQYDGRDHLVLAEVGGGQVADQVLPRLARRSATRSRTRSANSAAAATAASTTSRAGATSYIRTIACDQRRSSPTWLGRRRPAARR